MAVPMLSVAFTPTSTPPANGLPGMITRPGPILTRHPGEVFWQTGRPAVEPDSSSPDAINRLIDRLGVTYLLIDEERYVNAGLNPLKQYVEQYPDRVLFVWGRSHGSTSVKVFEIVPPK